MFLSFPGFPVKESIHQFCPKPIWQVSFVPGTVQEEARGYREPGLRDPEMKTEAVASVSIWCVSC